jgi:hypothetical protein
MSGVEKTEKLPLRKTRKTKRIPVSMGLLYFV